MRGAALRDYNSMYGFNRGVVVPAFAGNNLDEKLMTPARRKLYGDVPTKDTAAVGAGTTASSTDTPTKSCDSAAQQGAAIGGALGGAKGKALGGFAGAALGGLGKKKNSGC